MCYFHKECAYVEYGAYVEYVLVVGAVLGEAT